MRREVLLSLPAGPTTVWVSGQGPALIWTHGLFHPPDVEDHTLFGRMLASLKNVQVIRFDTRGYGPMAPASDAAVYRWDRLGDDVLAVADALGLDTFVAAGFSMGSAASLHAAVRDASRLRALVLVAPPNAWALRPAQAEAFHVSAKLVRDGGVEALLATYDRAFAEGRSPGTRRAQAAMLARLKAMPADVLEGLLLGAADSDLPPVESLKGLDLPAFVYAFEQDPEHPTQVAEAVAQALPRSTLRRLVALDDAQTVTREVQAFLDALP